MTSDPAPRPALDQARLTGGHPALLPDLRVEVVEEAASTQQLVVERAREGAPDGLVVVAEHQSAGRGRLDRTWETPARAALTFSMLLRPQAPPAAWPWLPLLVGYAVDRALQARGFDVGLKWPNDVLIGGLKVAGIIAERVETPAGPAAVVGVGLNVSQRAAELPVDTATSLDLAAADGPDAPDASDGPADRTDVLLEVLTSIREAYDAWEVGGEAHLRRLRESYAAVCTTLDQQVRVDLPDGTVLEGTARSIDESGRLVVETPQGLRPVSAGDVVHVRRVG